MSPSAASLKNGWPFNGARSLTVATVESLVVQTIGKPGSATYAINEMYKQKTGRDLDDTSGRDMQGFFVLAEAINRAGSTEPEKIQAALQQTSLKPEQLMMGYSGVKFDATGQNIEASTYLIQLQGKQYVSVWPAEAAAAALQWPMKGWK